MDIIPEKVPLCILDEPRAAAVDRARDILRAAILGEAADKTDSESIGKRSRRVAEWANLDDEIVRSAIRAGIVEVPK